VNVVMNDLAYETESLAVFFVIVVGLPYLETLSSGFWGGK
jgi:hypothetical protein